MNTLQLPREFNNVCEQLIENITPGNNRKFIRDMASLMKTAIESPKLKYTSLASIGPHSEKTYRNMFSRDFNWEKFNEEAIFEEFSMEDTLAAVIDPSYLTKSGKHTPGLNLYWSGVSSQMRRGLEISAVGVVDVEKEDCMMIGARQTADPSLMDEYSLSLLQWYLLVIRRYKDEIKKMTTIITADSYFANSTFVDGLSELGLSLVSRLRSDCSLRYIHDETLSPTPRGKRGPKPKFDGKVDTDNPDMRRFRHFTIDGVEGDYYTAVVNSPSLGNICVVIYKQHGRSPKVLFCTDLSIPGEQIAKIYKLRFKIEFCIRDAKQFMGLQDSQSRKYKALDFAFNLSFAMLNVSKVLIGKENLGISVGKLKVLLQLSALVSRIISMSGMTPDRRLIPKANALVAEMAKIRV